jgi:uncharacterized protein (TIGR02677 family)
VDTIDDTDRRRRLFAHAVADKSEAYRAVLGAFVDAKSRFTVHLRPEDVAEALPGLPLPEVGSLLESLAQWGNLRADPDTSRVTTVQDFLRARYLYSLTREGEAVEEAFGAYDAALGRRAELQAVALTDIRDQLLALTRLDPSDPDDAGKVHQGLLALLDRFRGLADNATAFMSSVQRSVDLADGDVDAFLAYRDRLVDYLSRFIRDLVTTSAEIGALLTALEPGVDALLTAAAHREAADAAPLDLAAPADEETAAPVPDEALARRLATWRERWGGLRHWFVGDRQRPSQSALLRDRARAAVPALLAAAATLNERRSGRSDRSADFRALALWFAQAPDDEACHRLWRASFGLAGARHLTVDPDSLDAREAAPVPPSTSWSAAPPIVVSSAERRHLAARATAEREQAAAARAVLATGRPTRLSDLDVLDPDAFALFLGLLGDALATRRADDPTAPVTTTSSDGSLLVRLTPTRDGRTAEVRTSGGVLRGPDHVLTVTDVTADVPLLDGEVAS